MTPRPGRYPARAAGRQPYPLSRYEFGLLPEPVRITTNKLAERWVIPPLLLAGLPHFTNRDAAPALTTAASEGWP
jgi:hypothetical protein